MPFSSLKSLFSLQGLNRKHISFVLICAPWKTGLHSVDFKELLKKDVRYEDDPALRESPAQKRLAEDNEWRREGLQVTKGNTQKFAKARQKSHVFVLSFQAHSTLREATAQELFECFFIDTKHFFIELHIFNCTYSKPYVYLLSVAVLKATLVSCQARLTFAVLHHQRGDLGASFTAGVHRGLQDAIHFDALESLAGTL